MTVFLNVFCTKLVKLGRTEVSIPPIDAKFQDISLGKGPGPWIFETSKIFLEKVSKCGTCWGSKMQKKRKLLMKQVWIA